MMIDPRVHLTDEELIAVRDGECGDTHLLNHMDDCDYCRAVLEEWRRFAGRVEVSAPSEPPGKSPHSPRALQRQGLLQRASKESHLSFLLNESDNDWAVVRADMSYRPEAPPASWIESAQRRLDEVPDRHSLGNLTLYVEENAEIHLQADAARRIEKGEAIYDLNGSRLHLTIRQAGFTTLLVARLAGSWRKGDAGEYDLTLVPASGRIRTQPLVRKSLPALGMAWFPVPAGESTLLIHLEDTWQLRLRKILPSSM